MKARPLALGISLFVVACGEAPPPVETPVAPPSTGTPAPASGLTSVDEAAMDKSVPACTDFYQYACGSWLKNTPIPKEESSWTRSFDVVQQRNEIVLREIAEGLAKGEGPKDTPYAKQIGDFYAACSDESAIEANDAKPLAPVLKKIDEVKTPKDLAALVGVMHAAGAGPAFNFDSGQDAKDATQVIGIVSQGGLGLPERDYYVKPDEKMKEVTKKYVAHVERTLVLAGEKPADAARHAPRIYAIEYDLATASMPAADLRDPQKTYHRIERAGLIKAAPKFVWSEYFDKVGGGGVTALNVQQPEFFVTLDRLMSESACGVADKKACKVTKGFPVDDWRAYLRYHYVSSVSRSLSKRFVDESFSYEQALTGAEVLPPRWKRCVRSEDDLLGEAIGRAFVQKTLGPTGKETTVGMVKAIEAVMKDRLAQMPWMDPPTRARAIEKLGAIANKIAYPDKWRSYDGLVIDAKDHFGNRERAAGFETRRRLAKIGKPLDRTEWEIPPAVVNAYYEASMNEIAFPAGILQPPFYSNGATLATNFGSIGMVIGHELTHGFDDEGRQYDAKGNLAEWWTPGVSAEFEKRAACVVKQFDSYISVGDVHLQGKLTLGENIADLGGLRISLAALEKQLEGKPPVHEAYTPEQQFFLGYAQEWCTNMREEMLRMLAQVDPHAPGRYRVNGPLGNLPEFAKAFSCPAGSAMVRADHCEVW
jgi:putative endopeptidase